MTKRSSRIFATLSLQRHSGGTFRAILALTTRYGLPQRSWSRVAQKSFHLLSLHHLIALLNLLLASLNSVTICPALSLLAATARCSLLLNLRVALLNPDNSVFHQWLIPLLTCGGKISFISLAHVRSREFWNWTPCITPSFTIKSKFWTNLLRNFPASTFFVEYLKLPRAHSRSLTLRSLANSCKKYK